jgi:cytidine deaminase
LNDSEDRKPWPAEERRAQPERRRGERRRGVERRESPPVSSPEDRRILAKRRAAERRKTQGRDRRNDAAWQPVPMDQPSAASLNKEGVLLAAAADARSRAHAQYSHFMVGAALETADGQLIGGCNIENATYGLTLCAERVALVKALSDGHAVFTRIAVIADTEAPTPPCGPCRQLLWEYCGDIDIILGNLTGPTGRFRLSALLPLPFDRRLLR